MLGDTFFIVILDVIMLSIFMLSESIYSLLSRATALSIKTLRRVTSSITTLSMPTSKT
jgi:hypothetical protein